MLFDKVVQINSDIKTAILIVEQKVRKVFKLCQRVYAFKLGNIAFVGAPTDLTEDTGKLKNIFL
jgi:ABC-type branched-subunit amino acid transport system ATPase component